MTALDAHLLALHPAARPVAFLFTALVGASIGSFLNVVIYRLPEGMSVLEPKRSHCPACGGQIAARDNVPIVSWLLLGRRCRACRAAISARYPAVEALTAILALAIVWRFGFGVDALVLFAFAATMVAVAFIDLDHFIIPDVITYPGLVLAFVFSRVSFEESLTGFLAGWGGLWLVAFSYWVIRREEGLGGGDIKLLGLIGALLGPAAVAATIFLGAALGTAAGLGVMLLTRSLHMKLKLPFGPFLVVGVLAWLLWRDVLIDAFLGFQGVFAPVG